MLLGQLHNIVVWIISLNQNLTLKTPPASTTGYLGQELEGLLPRPEIRQIESRIRIDYTD